MKIVFTGGGTGGHFYPIIAIAEEVNRIADERNLLQPKLYFMGPSPYDAKVLFENDITFRKTAAGKLRKYNSILNFFDLFKTAWGIVEATIKLFAIYPDVVFSKGGYASFPTAFAARLLRIPVFVHESDAVPGRANLVISKFAKYIAVSYPEAAAYFKDKNVAFTGTPVRKAVANPAYEGAHEYLDLDENIPTLLVLGGSQGAQKINETLLEALPNLLNRYQIIHQTGKANFDEVEKLITVVLEGHQYKDRYKPFAYLNDLALRMSAGAADLIISRAGSTSIFEIASWGKPSILIPIPLDVSRDQSKNAFEYARAKAAVVVEQENLQPNLLTAEIDRVMEDKKLREEMRKATETFRKPDAAKVIADELVTIALKHED